MKKKRVAALVMAAILGVTGFSVPGIGVVQAEKAHTEMSGEAEQQEINLAADRGSTARASKFLAASGNLPAREPGLAFDGISDNNGEADNSRGRGVFRAVAGSRPGRNLRCIRDQG